MYSEVIVIPGLSLTLRRYISTWKPVSSAKHLQYAPSE
jgi:hypothetical protein